MDTPSQMRTTPSIYDRTRRTGHASTIRRETAQSPTQVPSQDPSGARSPSPSATPDTRRGIPRVIGSKWSARSDECTVTTQLAWSTVQSRSRGQGEARAWGGWRSRAGGRPGGRGLPTSDGRRLGRSSRRGLRSAWIPSDLRPGTLSHHEDTRARPGRPRRYLPSYDGGPSGRAAAVRYPVSGANPRMRHRRGPEIGNIAHVFPGDGP